MDKYERVFRTGQLFLQTRSVYTHPAWKYFQSDHPMPEIVPANENQKNPLHL